MQLRGNQEQELIVLREQWAMLTLTSVKYDVKLLASTTSYYVVSLCIQFIMLLLVMQNPLA